VSNLVRLDLAGSGGSAAHVTIARPEKRNSMTHEMWRALADAALGAAAAGARVLVVSGEGEHFCAGADIAEFAGGRGEDYDRDNRRAEEAIVAFPGPSVAAIRGSCVGGGVSIATACDVRIAATDARFGVTPAKLGIIYPSNALERLVALTGPSGAKKLMFSGSIVGADEALRVGLVDEVVAPGDLDATVTAWVDQVLSWSALTQQATKEMIAEVVRDGSVGETTRRHWEALSRDSGEATEGVAAFGERRPPRFPWRRPES
jgi:enoyl-CoA hydratase/carnithine racemase